MKGVLFNGANDVLGPPEGQEENVYTLVIHRGVITHNGDNQPYITSCWEFSEEEMEEFIKTRKIFFCCWGGSHPPMFLIPSNPLTTQGGFINDGIPLNPNRHKFLNPKQNTNEQSSTDGNSSEPGTPKED